MTQGFWNLTEHFFNLPKLFRRKETDSPVKFYPIYGKSEITSVLFFSKLLSRYHRYVSFLYLLSLGDTTLEFGRISYEILKNRLKIDSLQNVSDSS